MRLYDNLPADWGCYYRTCDYCGSTYHASEGNCDCRVCQHCDDGFLDDWGNCDHCSDEEATDDLA